MLRHRDPGWYRIVGWKWHIFPVVDGPYTTLSYLIEQLRPGEHAEFIWYNRYRKLDNVIHFTKTPDWRVEPDKVEAT